jgi:zinc protease
VAGGETALAEALATARAAAPLRRAAERRVTFDDLPALGPAGREVSRREIADMGVTIVTFANGATLTFKHTEFDHGVVEVRLRFGRGLGGLPADRPALAWAQNLVAPSGIADLDLDAMQRMLTGRRIGMGFSIDDDAFVLGSQTSAPDLSDELRLLATKLADPGWDPRLFARARQASLGGYDLQFASATARAGRELQAFLRHTRRHHRRPVPRLLRAVACRRAGPRDHRRRRQPRRRGGGDAADRRRAADARRSARRVRSGCDPAAGARSPAGDLHP